MTDQTVENPLNIRPISEGMEKKWAEKLIDHYKKFYTHDWVFSTIWEKGIVLGSLIWTIFSIGRFVYGYLL